MKTGGCTLLNTRRWYEMNKQEINFVIDLHGKVSKIKGSSIFEVNQQQADELISIKEKQDKEVYLKFITRLRNIKEYAEAKFTAKAAIMGSGALGKNGNAL